MAQYAGSPINIFTEIISAPNNDQVQIIITTQKERTEDRIQVPCLDEKGIDGKRIYQYRQWLERIKRYTKRRYNTNIEPLVNEVTITETERNTKEEKI